MPNTFIKNTFNSLYADEADNYEIMFYYSTLYEDIKLFADLKQKDKVENHIYGIICGLCYAEEMQGFKRGLSYAFNLAAECTAAPNLSTYQVRESHESLYGADMRYSAALRTAEASRETPSQAAVPKKSHATNCR